MQNAAKKLNSLYPQELSYIPIKQSEPTIRGYIESYGTFLPETTMETSDTVKMVKSLFFLPLEYVTGIKRRRVSNEYSSMDYARKAVEKCLNRSSYTANDIDLVLCCNISKADAGGKTSSLEPTMSFAISSEFGIKNAICFDVNNACAGLFTGIYIADSMIKNKLIRRALVFSGEYISHLAETAAKEISSLKDPRLACLTLGNAGAAILLDGTEDANKGFEYTEIKTFAEHCNLCKAYPTPEEHGGVIMHTDAPALSALGSFEGTLFVADGFTNNKYDINNKTFIINHQINGKMRKSAEKQINGHIGKKTIDGEQLLFNVAEVGNTATTSQIVALAKFIADRTINTGDQIVFGIQASGLTVGTFSYKMDDLPDRIRDFKQTGVKTSTPEAVNPKESSPKLMTPKVKIDILGFSNDPKDFDTVKTTARAANGCLRKTDTQLKDLSYLIHCGMYKTQSTEEPSHASMILGKLFEDNNEKHRSIMGFDVINASMGWLNGCYVASSLLVDNSSKIIVTCAECDDYKTSGKFNEIDITELCSATLLSSSDGSNGFSNFHFKNFPEFIGKRETVLSLLGPNTHIDVLTDENYENYLINCIQNTLTEKFENSAEYLNSFTKVILPQRSSTFVSNLAKVLGLANEKVVDINAEKDYFSNSIPSALNKIIADGNAKPGDKVLLIEASSGIQVAMAIYTF